MKSLLSISVLTLTLILFNSCGPKPYESEIGRIVTLSDDTYSINPTGNNLVSSITIASTDFINAEKERVLLLESDANNATGTIKVLSAQLKDIVLTDRSNLNPENTSDLMDFVDHFELIVSNTNDSEPAQVLASSETLGGMTILEDDFLSILNHGSSSQIILKTIFTEDMTEQGHLQIVCTSELQFLYINE